jgi:hypothetical protein
MALSSDTVLLYVLHTGISGRVTEGRIERDGTSGICVYNRYGLREPYFSGERLRSWCVVDSAGRPIGSWCSIHPEDHSRL